MAKRILVVDDDPQTMVELRDGLEIDGYEVVTAGDGEQALERGLTQRLDLILLDLMLPRRSGLDVCRELRARASAVPIIMLTARARDTDKVLGLEIGADDYITKPFSIAEVLARIRAVLRRTGGVVAAPDRCVIGNVEVDFRSHSAQRAGQHLRLTARELELLRYMVTRKGEVVTREQLLADVWGLERAPSTRTVDNFVAKLRQKVEAEPRQPRHVVTVHGLGYKFVG